MPMPEFLGARKDSPPRPWTVTEGAYVEKHLGFDLDTGNVILPFGSDNFSRTVRARELTAAQVSLPLSMRLSAELDCSSTVINAAEAYRIHVLLKRAGFQLDELFNGSERLTGERVVKSKQWKQAVLCLACIPPGKSADSYISGVRSIDKRWATALERLAIVLNEETESIETCELASTELHDNHLPHGFAIYVEMIGKLLDIAIIAGQNVPDSVSLAQHVSSVLRNNSGIFAELKFDTSVRYNRTVLGRTGRKRTFSATGINPKYMHRALTDPERRVFSRYIPANGSVIVIDQSASMNFTEEDLQTILSVAPGSLIIGYSHTPGNFRVPNAWIISDRGKVCDHIPPGGNGNGVDGPVLKYAISKRLPGEQIIWLTDGVITDCRDDSWHTNLGKECLNLVRSHGINMVETFDELERAAKHPQRGNWTQSKIIGPMTHLAKMR